MSLTWSNLVAVDRSKLKAGQRVIKLADGSLLPVGIEGDVTIEGFDTSDATATPEMVLDGEIFYNADGRQVGTLVPATEDIDLSFITAGAGDIRSGKVGADVNGNPVTGTLVPSSGGGTDIYKCASVDTASKTWTGYKAVLSDSGEYSFEDTATTGLTYTIITPVVDNIYTGDALAEIAELWMGMPDLLMLMPLDNDTTATIYNADGTSTATTPTVNGTVTFVSAGLEDNSKAASLTDGAYITVDALDVGFFQGNATIIANVYQTGSDRTGYLAGAEDYYLGLDNNGGTYNMWAGNSGWNIIESDSSAGRSSVAYKRNQWVQLAYIHDAANGEYRLYVNGELAKTVTNSEVIASGVPLRFGSWGNAGYPLTGLLKDCRVYKGVVSAAGLKQLYQQYQTTPRSVFHAPLTEASTTAATGQTLTTGGTVAYTTYDGMACAMIGESTYYDDGWYDVTATGYITSAENINITGQASRTVAFWAKPMTGQTWDCAVGWGASQTTGYLFNCGARAEGTTAYASFTTWGNDTTFEAAYDDKMHHYCYVYDEDNPETLTIYVDGAKQTFAVADVATQNSPVWIGQSGAGGWEYAGYLADVRIYNYVLSDAEITELAAR